MEDQEIQPKYYADVDPSGNIVGFYVAGIHQTIPETVVEISEELWREIGADSWRYKYDGTQIREKTEQELADERANQPVPPKSPEQQRIEALEAAIAELTMLVAMQNT